MAAVVGSTAHDAAAAAAADSTPSASSSTTSQPPRRPSNTRFYSATEDVYGDDDDNNDDATEAAGEAGSRTPSSTHHLQQPAGLFGPSTQAQLASPHIVLQADSPPTPGSSQSKLPSRRPLAAPSFGGPVPKAGFQTSWNRNGSGNERYVSNPSSARGERNFSSAISSHRANLPASRQYFLTVVPPEDFPTDPPHPRSLGASASYNHLRRGVLLPLYPTLNGQLYAVAREYGLPSIGGLSIYLCEDADGNLGPRIGETSWQALWQCYFEQEQAPDVGTSAWPSPRSPSFSNWGPDEGWRARSISGRHVPIGLRTPSAYPERERERREVSGSSAQSGKRHSSPSHPLPEETSTSFSGSSRASSSRMAAALPIVGRVEWAVDKHRAAWWSQWIGESVDTAANARSAPSRARSLKLASSSIAAQRTPQGTEPASSSSLKADNSRGGQDVAAAARTPNNGEPSQSATSPPRENGSQAAGPRASQQHLASPASVAEDATVREEDVGRPVSGTYEGYSMLSDGEGIGAGAGDRSQDGKQTSQDSDNDAPSRRPTGLTRKRSRRSAAAPSRHVKQASRDLHRLTFDSGTSNSASHTDGSSHRRHPSTVSLRNEQRASTNSSRLPRQPEGGTSQHSSFMQMPESDESMWRALKDAPQPPLPLRSEEAAARDHAEQVDGEQRPYGLGNVSDWIEHTQKSPNLLKHRSAFIQKDIDHDRRSEAGESEATGETDESFVPREDDIGEVMQLWAANGSNAPMSRDSMHSMQFPKTASSASFPQSAQGQAQAQAPDQAQDQPQAQAQLNQPQPTQVQPTQPQRQQSQSLGDHLPVGATRPATLLSPITLDDAAVFAGSAPQLGDLATNAGSAANGQGTVDDAAPSEKDRDQGSVDLQADNVPSGPPSIHSSSTSISGLEDFERALQLLSPVASNSTHSPSLAQLGWSKEGKMSARDSLAAARCLSTSVAPSPRWLRSNGSSTASGMYSPLEGSFSTQPRSPVLGMINGIRPMSSPSLSAPDRTPRAAVTSGRSSESKMSSPLVTQEVREVETEDDQPGEAEANERSVRNVQSPGDESVQQEQASLRGSIVSKEAPQAEVSQAEAEESPAEASLRDSTISANQDERQSLRDSTVSGNQNVLQPPSSVRASTIADNLSEASASPRHSVVSGSVGHPSPSVRNSAASNSVQGMPPSARDSRLSDAASEVLPSVRGSIMSSVSPSARHSTASGIAPDAQEEAPATNAGDSNNVDEEGYAARSERLSTATSKHASQPAMSTSASGYTLDAQSEYEDDEASEAGEAGEGWTVIPDGQEAAGTSHSHVNAHDLDADESQVAGSNADAGSASQRSSIAWAGEGKYRYPDIRRGSTMSTADSADGMDKHRQSETSSRDLRNSAMSNAEVQEDPEVSATRALSPASAATALASAEERPSTPCQASQLSSLDTSAAPLMEPQQLTIFDSPTSTTSADALLTDARARHMTGLVTEWPPLEEKPEREQEEIVETGKTTFADPTQGDEVVPLSAQSNEDPEHSPSESAYWKHTVSVPTDPRQSPSDSPSASQPLQNGEEQDAQMLSAPQPSFTRRPPLSPSTSDDAAPSITRMIRGLSFSASSDAASEKAASPGPADAPPSDSGSTCSPSQLPYEGDREVAESDASGLPDAEDAAARRSEHSNDPSHRDSVTSASDVPTSRANFTHMDLSTKLNEHESDDGDGWSQSESHSSHLFDDDTQRISTSLSNPSRLGDSGPGTPSFYLERHLNGNSRPTSKLSDLAMGEFSPNGHAVEPRMDAVGSSVDAVESSGYDVEARNDRLPTRESSEKTASLVDEGKYGSEADFASERSVQEGEGNDVSDDLDAMLFSINAFNNNSSGSGSGSSRAGHVRDSGSSDVRRVSGATESDAMYATSGERAWNHRDSLGDDDDNVAMMTQDVRTAVRSALTNSERYSHDDPLPAPASMQSMKSFYSGTGSAGGSPVLGASSPSSPRGVPRRAYSGDPQAWRRPSASSLMSSGSASSSMAHQQLYGAVPGAATAGGTPGVMPPSTTTSAVLSPRIARFKTLPPSPSLAHLNNEFIQPSSPLQSSFSLHSTPMPEDHTDGS